MTIKTIYTESIQQLYVAYFSRPADNAGLAYWEGVVAAANGDTTAISAAFSTSAEYLAIYGSLNNTAKVNAVYMNEFGRAPDPEGLAFYVNLLDTGRISISEMVTTIARGAQGTDKIAYDSKVNGAIDFTMSLDTTEEITAYASGVSNGTAINWLAGITSVETLITQQAQLPTVTAAIAAGGTGGGQTFTLTTGIDTFVGSTGNDVFTANDGYTPVTGATQMTLTGLDSLDGGTGNNTLNVLDTVAILIPTSATVKNIQTANLTSAATVAGNVSAWTGLTSLTVSEAGGTAAGITAASTTAVTLTDSAQGAGAISVNGGSKVAITSVSAGGGTITVAGATDAVTVSKTSTATGGAGTINVYGGTTVNVTQTAANAVNTDQTSGAVTILGGANTTSVSVAASAIATKSGTVAGVLANTVSITDVNGGGATDAAGTITSATVSNFTTLSIVDNALTTLSVTGGSGNIIIDNNVLTLATATNKTLALTINGETGGTLDDADIYTTLNVTTAGASSTLANVTTGGVTAITVAGTKGLTLNSTTGLTALKTATVTGAAGLTADLSGATVTAVDTSGTTGTSTITLDATKATYTGGAGVDNVTVVTGATKAISLGAGDDSLTLGSFVPTAAISGGDGTDTLSITAAAAATASGSATFAGLVTGFEHLTLTGATNQTIDLAVLGNYNYVTTSGGNGLTLSNLSSGGTLALTGTGTAYTIGNSAFTAGTNDIVNLVLLHQVLKRFTSPLLIPKQRQQVLLMIQSLY
jgi:S-layer protein